MTLASGLRIQWQIFPDPGSIAGNKYDWEYPQSFNNQCVWAQALLVYPSNTNANFMGFPNLLPEKNHVELSWWGGAPGFLCLAIGF